MRYLSANFAHSSSISFMARLALTSFSSSRLHTPSNRLEKSSRFLRDFTASASRFFVFLDLMGHIICKIPVLLSLSSESSSSVYTTWLKTVVIFSSLLIWPCVDSEKMSIVATAARWTSQRVQLHYWSTVYVDRASTVVLSPSKFQIGGPKLTYSCDNVFNATCINSSLSTYRINTEHLYEGARLRVDFDQLRARPSFDVDSPLTFCAVVADGYIVAAIECLRSLGKSFKEVRAPIVDVPRINITIIITPMSSIQTTKHTHIMTICTIVVALLPIYILIEVIIARESSINDGVRRELFAEGN